MIDLLFSFGAAAKRKTLLRNQQFDDSQDCLTFLKRRVEGFGRLRIGERFPDGGGPLVPWRSL